MAEAQAAAEVFGAVLEFAVGGDRVGLQVVAIDLENLRRVVVLREHDRGRAKKQREPREDIGGSHTLAMVIREKHDILDRADTRQALNRDPCQGQIS